MKKIFQIFSSFRPSVCFLAAFIANLGFRITGQISNYSTELIIFLISCFTMLQNDYFDRNHDLLKGKSFVHNNKRIVQVILLFGWFLVSVMIVYCSKYQFTFFLLESICIMYSFARHFVMLSAITVSIASGAPILIGSLHTEFYKYSIPMFISIVLIIFGREILKDIEDVTIDKGYKKTMIAENILSLKEAKVLAGFCFLFGLLIIILNNYAYRNLPVQIIGTVVFLFAIYKLFSENNIILSKKYLDIGMLILIYSFY